VPGPNWSDDDPADVAKLRENIGAVVGLVSQAAIARVRLTLDDVRRWHAGIHTGCSVPSAAYVGNVRGDPSYPDLVDYEAGVGPTLADGFPERVGV